MKLFKDEMGSLLPHTAGTKFKVEDAQEKAQKGTKSGNDFWTDAGDFANQVRQGAGSLGQKAKRLWDGISSLFQ